MIFLNTEMTLSIGEEVLSMAKRPVYYIDSYSDVRVKDIEFLWTPGFSISQKQKSIKDFHANISKTFNCSIDKILEISTKSNVKLGVELSAFNLNFKKNGIFNSVEVFFQSSKIFELGGPYTDLLNFSSRIAKTDKRLRESGELKSFLLFDQEWPLEPITYFYDWIYINALYQNKNLEKELLNYEYFTDIEFNPKRSLNCQAHSAALYVSLYKKNLLEKVINDRDYFSSLLKTKTYIQEKLF